ncbi:hypothetical protein FBU30_003518 [Linnemannia zychae]|nr:hypothetical protein FBU30_003518 [Linnemannia zychae]
MLRTIATSSAVRTVRKPVQVAAVARSYSTASTLSDKERAEEAQYIRQKEQEQIKKLREELARKEKEIEELKKAKK